jgi:hypothetical protein
MARRGFPVLALAAALLLLLSGCSLKTPEELYSLPQPPPEYDYLQAAIAQVQQELSAQYSTTVEYAAPLSGDNTQTVQLQDLDGDGVQESAVAFFRVSGAENPLMIYIFHQLSSGAYQVYTVIEGGGSAINSVAYEELDETPGKELVVQWQINDDVHLLGVYSIAADLAQPLLTASYTSCQVMDLDRDGKKELLLLQLDSATGSGTVEYYDYSSELDAVVLDSSAPLSREIDSVSLMADNYVSDMIPALYITSTRADDGQSGGGLITDILVLGQEGLENITLDPETGSSSGTVRLKETYGTDINNDMVLELPTLTFLPEYGTAGSTNYWVTTWQQYDAQGNAYPVCTTYHNDRSGWYLVLPDQWLGQLVISRSDAAGLGQRSVTFYRWSGGDEDEPEAFLTIYCLTGTNRTVRASQGSRFILMEDTTTIYAAEFTGQWDCGLDQESLLENFHLIRTAW